MTDEELHKKLQVLSKWRTLLAGWQLGTRSREDPECQAVKDHRELTILLRAEMSALTNLLIEKKVFSLNEWVDALGNEAELLNEDFERRFPGVTSSEIGLTFDTEKVIPWMKNWKK